MLHQTVTGQLQFLIIQYSHCCVVMLLVVSQRKCLEIKIKKKTSWESISDKSLPVPLSKKQSGLIKVFEETVEREIKN